MTSNDLTYAVDFEGDPKALTYTFGGADPVAQVKAPAVLTTSTLDAFAGRLNEVGMLPRNANMEGYLNPQTGPFFVQEAQPGDSLAVHFKSIEPRFDFGISAMIPFFGALTSTPLTATL